MIVVWSRGTITDCPGCRLFGVIGIGQVGNFLLQLFDQSVGCGPGACGWFPPVVCSGLRLALGTGF